jgi:signal transduction histidine kinase
MMKPLYLFYALVIYVFLQFCWWTYLIVELNNEVYQYQVENVQLQVSGEDTSEQQSKLHRRLKQKWLMIIGEGSVFLSLLIIGGLITYRSFKKEVNLARQQKNFLLSITHEFKSPLASIKLYLQTLQKHDLDKEKRDSFISNAIRDSDRLNSLVENTLLANTINHKGYRFVSEEVNMSALSRLLVQKFNTSADETSKIEADIQEGLMMKGDKQSLLLMMSNLIENAVKYSPQSLRAKVSLKAKNNRLIFEVADEGIGIPVAERKNIFKKFYRLGDEETRKTKGTGLGLFLVKQIADHHHGKISVTDNKPKGSIFAVEFTT